MAPRNPRPVTGLEPRIAINVDLSITRLHNRAHNTDPLASKCDATSTVRSSKLLCINKLRRFVHLTLHLLRPGLIETVGRRLEGKRRGEGEDIQRRDLAKFGKLVS